MPGFDVAVGTLTIPIWAAGAASAVFVVAIVLAIGKAGAASVISALFRVAIILVAVYAGWAYMQRSTQEDQAAERRSLDERSAALMARAVAPGSALSCLDEVAGETVEAACERAVFASSRSGRGGGQLCRRETDAPRRRNPACPARRFDLRGRSRARSAPRLNSTASASSRTCWRSATAARWIGAMRCPGFRIQARCSPICATKRLMAK